MAWKDLSLREKAAYIHTGVRNGLLTIPEIEQAYNKFAEGGYTDYPEEEIEETTLPTLAVTPRGSYTSYTGQETNVPSLERYQRDRARETSINAANKIVRQKLPIVPNIPNRNLISRALGHLGFSDAFRTHWLGKEKKVDTCINTATSMYGPNNRVSGNITFAKNPEKYGFIPISQEDSDIGDLMQFTSKEDGPHHTAMITGWTKDGWPTLSYSNGNTTEYVIENGEKVYTMKKDNDDWDPDNKNSLYNLGTRQVFRFTGNDKDRETWEEEYEKKFK